MNENSETPPASGRTADDLLADLQVKYPSPPRETVVRPGDVVMSETGHIWWIHGHEDLSLSATGLRGRCLLLPELRAVYGKELTVLCRLTDHGPGSPPAHR